MSSVLKRVMDTRTVGDTPAMAAMRASRMKLMSLSRDFGLYAGRYALVETSDVTTIVEHKGEIRFPPSIVSNPDRSALLHAVLTDAIARGFGN